MTGMLRQPVTLPEADTIGGIILIASIAFSTGFHGHTVRFSRGVWRIRRVKRTRNLPLAAITTIFGVSPASDEMGMMERKQTHRCGQIRRERAGGVFYDF